MSEPPEKTPTSAGELRRLRNVSTYVDPFLVTKLPAEGTVSGGVIRLSDRTILGFVNRAFPDGTRVRVIYQEWLYAEEIPAPVEQPAPPAGAPDGRAAPAPEAAVASEAEPAAVPSAAAPEAALHAPEVPADEAQRPAADEDGAAAQPTAVPAHDAAGVEEEAREEVAGPAEDEPATVAEAARADEVAEAAATARADAATPQGSEHLRPAGAPPAAQPPVGYIEDDSLFDDSWEPPAGEELTEPEPAGEGAPEAVQGDLEYAAESEAQWPGPAAGPAVPDEEAQVQPAEPERAAPAQATERLVEDSSYAAGENEAAQPAPPPARAEAPAEPEHPEVEPERERVPRRTSDAWRGQSPLDFEDFGSAASRSWGREWQPDRERKPRRNRDGGAEPGTKVTVRRRRKSEEFPDDLSSSNDAAPAGSDDPWTAAFRPRRGRRDDD